MIFLLIAFTKKLILNSKLLRNLIIPSKFKGLTKYPQHSQK